METQDHQKIRSSKTNQNMAKSYVSLTFTSKTNQNMAKSYVPLTFTSKTNQNMAKSYVSLTFTSSFLKFNSTKVQNCRTRTIDEKKNDICRFYFKASSCLTSLR